MPIVFKPQYALQEMHRSDISWLLSSVFEGFPLDRHYYRQLPHFYWLSYDDQSNTPIKENPDLLLKGMVAGILRNVRIEAQIFPCLGIMDVCVQSNHRNQGLASSLLCAAENFAREHGIPLMLLFADNPALYRKNGFESRKAVVRWQMIDEIKQISGNVDERRMDDCFMMKDLTMHSFNLEEVLSVDLLGWIF